MPRKQKQYHFIYKTVNQVNGKYYIGMHSTNDLDDDYIGSGQRLWHAIKKYGKENFKRETLEFLPDRSSLKDREKEIVNEDLLQDPLCMNLSFGGEGGFISKEAAAAGGRAALTKPNRKLSDKHCKIISDNNRKRKLSDETRQKLSKKAKQRHSQMTIEDKKEFSDCVKKSMTDEVRQKISEAAKIRDQKKHCEVLAVVS